VNSSLLSLLLAFLGYSILNISQACQKLGLTLWPRRRLRGGLIWSTGTAGTSAAVFVLLAAVSLGSVALVGAMAGSGLASLALFSRFVLKEEFGRRELAGIGVILAAAVLVGARSRPAAAVEPAFAALYLLLAAVCTFYVLLWITLSRTNGAGLIIAGFAGALGGFIPIFQKVSTSQAARGLSLLGGRSAPGRVSTGTAQVLSNPYAAAWIALSLLSMLVLQFAHRREQAIRTVPAFAANTIVLPLLGGLAVFGERLHPLQWPGVAGILAGVMLLTLRPASGRRKKLQKSKGVI
jgi:drug/metabolite transporter (DMT)-like permease